MPVKWSASDDSHRALSARDICEHLAKCIGLQFDVSRGALVQGIRGQRATAQCAELFEQQGECIVMASLGEARLGASN